VTDYKCFKKEIHADSFVSVEMHKAMDVSTMFRQFPCIWMSYVKIHGTRLQKHLNIIGVVLKSAMRIWKCVLKQIVH